MIKRLLYPLGNLVRRVREYMDRRRDVVLISLALVATALFDFLLFVLTSRWNIPWYAVLGIAATAIVVIAILLLVIRSLYKSLGAIDADVETKRKRDEIARDERLATAINQAASRRDDKLADALNAINHTLQAIQKQTQDQSAEHHKEIMTALRKNAETIISAMREPVDGHE